MDVRTPLADGTALCLGQKQYRIEKMLGCGATSFVYTASYQDTFRTHKEHSVLIKELFPYHPKGLITRQENGEIQVLKDAKEYVELRKKSFLRGNDIHIDLQNICADLAGINMDSYEEHGSIYVVLGNLNGETLKEFITNRHSGISLSAAVCWMIRLLDALEVFHKNRLLHLDISPDNILFLPLAEDKSEKQRRILLIDFNSVWDMDDLLQTEQVYFSLKEHYSPPEVRMKNRQMVTTASDLFSVCAVFLELVRGKPLDFSDLYTGSVIVDPDEGLLKGAAPQVSAKVVDILTRGLRLPPKRRYQSLGELRRDFQELESHLFGEDVLKRAKTIFYKRAIPILAGTLAVALLLSFTAAEFSQRLRGYPVTAAQQFAADNAMTALAMSLQITGTRMEDDMALLQTLSRTGYAFEEAIVNSEQTASMPEPNKRYQLEDIEAFRQGASPLRFPILLELLNSPEDYRLWSDRMRNNLKWALTESGYPPSIQQEIAELYGQYISAYGDAVYINMQIVVLPLNDGGRKELYAALPYLPVFGDKFVAQPFGNSLTELENMLKAAKTRRDSISFELKSYGVNMDEAI